MEKIILILFFLSLTCNAKTIVCFTPGEDCERLFVEAINNAKINIEVQEYHLTNPAIVNALLQAFERKVNIRIILDKVSKKEAIPFLNVGIPVWIDNTVRIAHNKVMIIDQAIIIGGSYNPTESAQKYNAENLLIMDDTEIIKRYYWNFENRINKSKKYF